MDIRDRAETFSTYVGLELKGKITARGFTAKAVAERSRRSASALNKWLNGHVELPMSVLCEACEIIGVSPAAIVDAAYERLYEELGAPDPAPGNVAGSGDTRPMPLAAKKGRRRTSVDHAE